MARTIPKGLSEVLEKLELDLAVAEVGRNRDGAALSFAGSAEGLLRLGFAKKVAKPQSPFVRGPN